MIYPNPVYFDVVDSVYYDPHDVDNRLAIVNTHIYDRTNKDIKASVRDKFEASFDQKIGPVGVSLTGFYERSHNGFELGGYNPVGLDRYFYPQWPQSTPAIPKDTLVLNYRTPINSVETEAKGIELAITTKRLEPLNSTIRIDAAYHYSDSWWQNNYFEHASNLRYDPNLNQKVIPFWNPTSRRSDKLIVHYRFDTIFKPLGLWFTLNIQQIAMDRDQYTGLDDSLAVGYVDDSGNDVFIPQNERGDQKYSAMRRTYSDYNYITESKPGLWLINLRVSKELWPGSEVSFFVNNLLNSRPLYQRERVPSGAVSYIRRNPEIFYGIEFSTILDDLFDYVGRFY
jgi:hypothetical protein